MLLSISRQVLPLVEVFTPHTVTFSLPGLPMFVSRSKVSQLLRKHSAGLNIWRVDYLYLSTVIGCSRFRVNSERTVPVTMTTKREENGNEGDMYLQTIC